jgi:hypothetical protein
LVVAGCRRPLGIYQYFRNRGLKTKEKHRPCQFAATKLQN